MKEAGVVVTRLQVHGTSSLNLHHALLVEELIDFQL